MLSEEADFGQKPQTTTGLFVKDEKLLPATLQQPCVILTLPHVMSKIAKKNSAALHFWCRALFVAALLSKLYMPDRNVIGKINFLILIKHKSTAYRAQNVHELLSGLSPAAG